MAVKKSEQQKQSAGKKASEKAVEKQQEKKSEEQVFEKKKVPAAKNPDSEGGFAMIKAPIALMVICLSACLLLVGAYNLTYVDTTGVITKKLQAACEEVMTGNNFSMRTDFNLEATQFALRAEDYNLGGTEVNSIIINEDHPSQCAFEVTANGYNKGGLHLVIGMDDSGSVTGISVAGISETPGLGTKVSDEEYLSQYRGITAADFDGSTIQGVDNVTGATYSSKGVKKAVAAALAAYDMYKGEIFR